MLYRIQLTDLVGCNKIRLVSVMTPMTPNILCEKKRIIFIAKKIQIIFNYEKVGHFSTEFSEWKNLPQYDSYN